MLAKALKAGLPHDRPMARPATSVVRRLRQTSKGESMTTAAAMPHLIHDVMSLAKGLGGIARLQRLAAATQRLGM